MITKIVRIVLPRVDCKRRRCLQWDASKSNALSFLEGFVFEAKCIADSRSGEDAAGNVRAASCCASAFAIIGNLVLVT